VSTDTRQATSRSKGASEVTDFTFGALTFRVRGLSYFIGGDKLAAKVQALSSDELRAANRAAWKYKREWARRSARTQFMSDWDRTVFHEQVAESVCKATWKALQS
jgi:hypothetical protein